MPRRRLTPVSLGGVGLSNIGRECWFDFADGAMDTPEHEVIMLERTGAFPSRVRTQPREKTLPLNIVFKSGDTEGQARQLGRIFDPVLGPQILVVRDFNEVERRMTVEARRIIAVADAPQDDRQWTVPLVAARPLWENNLLTTFQDDIDSGTDPISFAARNAGNYDASPVFDATGRLAKYATQGYALMREVTYVWRSSFPATGPVTGTWLLELTDGGLDTTGIVDVSAITTTVTPAIAIGATMPLTVAVGSTTGFDQEGMILITPGANQEQFEYFVVDGTSITLTARQLGGTSAFGHAGGATAHQSHMMEDGRDIAVFIDNVQVSPTKVNVIAPDSANTKVWVEISDSPAVKLDLFPSFSTTATEIGVDTEDHGLSIGDYIGVVVGSNVEKMRITAISGRNLTVLRGQHNTTKLSLSSGNDVFKINHRIQVAYYYTKAPARPVNLEKPVIDMVLSTNTNWFWLTGANSGRLISAEDERQPGGWRRIKYPGSAAVPLNRLSTKIGFDHTVTPEIRFHDKNPDAGDPNFDAVEFVAACLTTSTTGAVEYDASVPWPFALQVIGRDALGLDELIANRFGHEAGDSHEPPEVYTNQAENPANQLSAVILRARNILVTGVSPADGTEEPLAQALAAGVDAQGFVLDAPTVIEGMITRARESTSGTALLQMQINSDGGSGPEAALTGIVSHDITATPASLREVCEFFAASPVLAAGSYFWIPFVDAGTGVVRVIRSTESLYPRGTHWEDTPFVEAAAEDLWFYILSTETDNQAEMERADERTGLILTVDDVDVEFAAATAPFVNLESEEPAYFYNTKWSQGAQDFRIEYLKRQEDIFRLVGLPVASGTYTGDGSSPRDIGLPFKPELVIVFDENEPTHVKGNEATWGSDSVQMDGGPLDGNGIQAMLPNGFTIGSTLNTNLAEYHWFAAGGGADALIATGSYSAPGGASGAVTGIPFPPVMVWGFNVAAGTDPGAIKTSAMSGNDSMPIDGFGVVTDEITTLDPDGFSFGTGDTMNTSAETVYWIAFRANPNLQLISYTGDDIDGRTLLEGSYDYVQVLSETSLRVPHERTSSLTGDQSHEMVSTNNLVANMIQSMNPLQVGDADQVNNLTELYHLVAFVVTGDAGPAVSLPTDITVDVLAKTVVDNEFGDSIRPTLLAVSDDWLSIPAGNSPVAVEALACSAEDEVGANREDHTLEFRDTWSA